MLLTPTDNNPGKICHPPRLPKDTLTLRNLMPSNFPPYSKQLIIISPPKLPEIPHCP